MTYVSYCLEKWGMHMLPWKDCQIRIGWIRLRWQTTPRSQQLNATRAYVPITPALWLQDTLSAPSEHSGCFDHVVLPAQTELPGFPRQCARRLFCGSGVWTCRSYWPELVNGPAWPQEGVEMGEKRWNVWGHNCVFAIYKRSTGT